MRISSYLIPLCTLALSACFTPYQTSFDCPVQNGVPCTSMTKINKMIDKGLLGKPEVESSKEHCGCESDNYEGDSEQKKIYITHFKPKMESRIIQEVPLETVSSQLESQPSIEASPTVENPPIVKELASPSSLTAPSASIEALSPPEQETPQTSETETIDAIQPNMNNPSLEPEVLEMPHNCQACTVTDEEINV